MLLEGQKARELDTVELDEHKQYAEEAEKYLRVFKKSLVVKDEGIEEPPRA